MFAVLMREKKPNVLGLAQANGLEKTISPYLKG
jgi:hypothetical protein